MSKISHLISDHVSVQSCVADVLNEIDDIDEIYLVYRKKSTGTYCENVCGDMKGLLFAILILQQYSQQCLDEQNP